MESEVRYRCTFCVCPKEMALKMKGYMGIPSAADLECDICRKEGKASCFYGDKEEIRVHYSACHPDVPSNEAQKA